jgi:deoxyribonuclease V
VLAYVDRPGTSNEPTAAINGRLHLLIIDGYVDLDPAGTPGLGAHLHAHTGLPIIGVAKTVFRAATHASRYTRDAPPDR